MIKRITQYEVYLVSLASTVGHEINKTRPCLIISPNEMNDNLQTVIIAPLTTKSHGYPTRVSVNVDGKDGWVVLDQIRTIDKSRLIKSLGSISDREVLVVKGVIGEMLVE